MPNALAIDNYIVSTHDDHLSVISEQLNQFDLSDVVTYLDPQGQLAIRPRIGAILQQVTFPRLAPKHLRRIQQDGKVILASMKGEAFHQIYLVPFCS